MITLRGWLVVAAIAILGLMPSCTLAGNTPAQELAQKGFLLIKFQPQGAEKSQDTFISDGSPYSANRGYGWDQDIKSQARRRDDKSAGIAVLDRDISLAEFSVDLPDGDYLAEVFSYDSQFSGMLTPLIDGYLAAEPVTYGIGKEESVAVAASSKGGKLRISFMGGREGYANSMVSFIRITPASSDPTRWQNVKNIALNLRREKEERLARRAEKRISRRAAYMPLQLSDARTPRQVFDLAGDWLFMPSQELKQNSASVAGLTVDDKAWHVLGVPQFWRPIEWWLYAAREGASHNYMRKERERCEDFTFDYSATTAGWYRQWISVPASFEGKKLVLKFDAVASAAQVFWNGKSVGSHAGMFGPFECDVTPYVKYGEKNLLAVLVMAGKGNENEAKQTAAVAVTVEVTREMLNSLPHGTYNRNMAGIWQPVHLEVTNPDKITDVYFRPRTDSARIETTIARSSNQPIGVRHIITDAQTGAVLCRSEEDKLSRGDKSLVAINNIEPRLWSPEHPNLYLLKTQLLSNGKVVDEVVTKVGFKIFEARGNRLYLNGKPYFMRGSNQPPHGLEPDNKALADKFMKLMHDGNLMFTRFHVGTPSQVWMDAADKYGVGTSIGETWPWVLMGDTPIPDSRLLKIWKQEFLELVRANRNHPSRLFWTISNESYFEGDVDQARRLEKFKIFSDLIKSVRAIDPDTPIVFHSGHVTDPKQRDQLLKPNGIDDGDVDDAHAYYGWYWVSPFHLNFKKIEADRGAGSRPLISQEASTGYPDNDTGHGTEKYIRDHVVPQVWVGQQAYYSARPDAFLDIHAQITKEYAEKVRRERTFLSGWGLFATVNWFKDVYDADRISPYPVYWAVKKAWQPVLISIDSPQRHFEAGQEFKSNVYVINDDPDRPRLTDLTLRWRVFSKSDDSGATGFVKLPDCGYDSKNKAEVTFHIPTKLPLDRSNMTLSLDLLKGDEVISRNDYPLICAKGAFYKTNAGAKLLVIENSSNTASYLKNLGYDCESRTGADWMNLSNFTGVVIADKAGPGSPDALRSYVQNGGRVLVLDSSDSGDIVKTALGTLPRFKVDSLKTVGAEGEFADVLAPELLSGMDPMDTHWWNAQPNDLVRVCRTSFQVPDAPGITKLVQHINPHGYIHSSDLERLTSWPVIKIEYGKGCIIADSMIAAQDPLAKRFLRNLIDYMLK